MTNHSPLRRLAREYFEGNIDRSDYVAQRRDLIASLVAGGNAPDSSQSSRGDLGVAHADVFHALAEKQPDANDLANALANRANESVAVETRADPVQKTSDAAVPPDRANPVAVIPAAAKKSRSGRWLRRVFFVVLLFLLVAGALLAAGIQLQH